MKIQKRKDNTMDELAILQIKIQFWKSRRRGEAG
jgi:hypothetical protein